MVTVTAARPYRVSARFYSQLRPHDSMPASPGRLLKQPAEFTLSGRWTECAPVACLLFSEEGEKNTRIYSFRSLAKTRACLAYCSAQEGFWRNGIVDYKFTPHYVCISTLCLDETFKLFRRPVACVAFSFVWISPATIHFSKEIYAECGPKHPSVLYVPEHHSPEVKPPGREVSHSLLSSADVKNGTSCTLIPPYAFHDLLAPELFFF